MASNAPSRPPTGNGGSRPPTSRFVEGSMNDRVSSTPPPQFLGPEQLKVFEKQFYSDHSPTSQKKGLHGKRRERPFSESSVPSHQQLANAQGHTITHRKSMGFFGRVRDALGWNLSSRSHGGGSKQDVSKKHSSLQEPPPSRPRPDHLRPAKSYSEMYNIPQLSNLNPGASTGAGARPSRDDVLQSYNHLMATGFFQSHAIQSTRHAGPASRGNDRRTAPPMPSIPGSGPCSPEKIPARVSSIDSTTATSGSNSPQSPPKIVHRGRRIARSEPEPEEEPVPMPMSNHNEPRESHYESLRGRKRNRADAEDAVAAKAEAAAPGASTTSSFAQPLKRVAKKLRKMPSSNRDVQMADGVVHLPPSMSIGGTVYLKEKAVRMRSPSPTPPEVAGRRPDRQQRRHDYKQHQQQYEREHQQLPSRRTFSNSSRGGERGRLRKRGKSTSLRSRSASRGDFDMWDVTSERGSMDEIHQDTTATMIFSDPLPMRSREPTPLSVVPDANRGIPSVPRIPDQYHLYHKPPAQYHRKQYQSENVYVYDDQDENVATDEWHFGEAL